MAKKKEKEVKEDNKRALEIKNSLKANQDILYNHPNLKESIEAENIKLREELEYELSKS